MTIDYEEVVPDKGTSYVPSNDADALDEDQEQEQDFSFDEPQVLARASNQGFFKKHCTIGTFATLIEKLFVFVALFAIVAGVGLIIAGISTADWAEGDGSVFAPDVKLAKKVIIESVGIHFDGNVGECPKGIPSIDTQFCKSNKKIEDQLSKWKTYSYLAFFFELTTAILASVAGILILVASLVGCFIKIWRFDMSVIALSLILLIISIIFGIVGLIIYQPSRYIDLTTGSSYDLVLIGIIIIFIALVSVIAYMTLALVNCLRTIYNQRRERENPMVPLEEFL